MATGSIKHQASRTNGHTQEKKEGQKEKKHIQAKDLFEIVKRQLELIK